MDWIRFVRRALAPLGLALPFAAVAQAPATDCPAPPSPPSAEAIRTGMAQARDRGFLWRIQKDGTQSYLYGTVHVARLPWMFPGPRVREALAASATVALELDLLDPDIQRRMTAGVAAKASDALPASLQQRLAKRARAECVEPDQLSGMKPEFQIATLSMLAGRRSGLEPGFGVDLFLSNLARREGKPVVSLETVDEQLRALASRNRAEAIEMVGSALDELDSGRAQQMLSQIAQLWAAGDHARLARYEEWCECQRTPAEAAAMRRLLDARNPALATRIDTLHRSGKRVFAAVGSLHMTGPRGLPALMAQRGYRVERVVLESPAPDLQALWDFDDPAASEARFRERLDDASHEVNLSLRTQIARTLGLRGQFAQAHQLLDGVDAELAGTGAEPRVRSLLERGRLWRSAREPAKAQPLFMQAVQQARAAGLDNLHVDALHMVALVETTPDAQLDWNRRALAAARASADPQARRWEASLSHNIGYTLHEAGRHEEALQAFRDALAARLRDGAAPSRQREARWMVAWELRALRRHDEALGALRELERELAAAGATDGFVPEEIAENLLALGQAEQAKPYFAQAHALLSRDESPDRPDDARLARLLELSR